MPYLQQLDALYLNGGAAIGLVCLYYIFFKSFQIKSQAEARFFLFNALGWSANLIYLAVLQTYRDDTASATASRTLVVFVINTIAHTLFLLAAAQAGTPGSKRRERQPPSPWGLERRYLPSG